MSAVTWGISDFIGGFATKRVPALVVVLWSQLAGLLVGLVAAPLLGGSGLSASALFWGAVAGLTGSVGLVALYRGLAEGAMAVVAPVSAVLAAAIPLMVGLGMGERPELSAWLGMAVAVPAIWLVSRQGTGEWGHGLGLGAVAGLGFGFFFVFISLAPDDAGLWPLIPARFGSLALVGSLLAVRRLKPVVPRSSTAPIVVAGVGDMIANMFFLAAVQRGLLSMLAVVSSLYPVVTVLLARIVLAEVVGARRWAGIGLAVGALALISI